MQYDRIEIYTDGASRGNPGPAASAFRIVDGNGNEITKDSRFLGLTTNNRAEYEAVIMALEKAKDITGGSVKVFSDSNLLVNQLSGDWKVKNKEIKRLFKQVRELEKRFDEVKFVKLPRDDRRIDSVDALCNRKLDEKLS